MLDIGVEEEILVISVVWFIDEGQREGREESRRGEIAVVHSQGATFQSTADEQQTQTSN